MIWEEVTNDPLFSKLTNQEQTEVRARWVDAVLLPEYRKAGVPEEDIVGARQEAISSFDNGQGIISSGIGSAARGMLGMGTSAIQGAGVLTGLDSVEQAGLDLEQSVQDTFNVNPERETTNFVGDVLGNVGGFVATAGAGGLAGKGLGVVGAARAGLTGLDAAAAATRAASLGAEVGGLGTGFFAGAGGAAQEADKYGITGADRYTKALLGGLTEVVSEKIPFLGGMGSELRAISKVPGLSSISPQAAGGFVKATGSEIVEELFANTAGNLTTALLAPAGVETPDILDGSLKAIAGGAIGGVAFGIMGIPSANKAAKAQAALEAAGDPEAAAVIAEADATRTPTIPVTPPEVPSVGAADVTLDEVITPLQTPQEIDLEAYASQNPALPGLEDFASVPAAIPVEAGELPAQDTATPPLPGLDIFGDVPAEVPAVPVEAQQVTPEAKGTPAGATPQQVPGLPEVPTLPPEAIGEAPLQVPEQPRRPSPEEAAQFRNDNLLIDTAPRVAPEEATSIFNAVKRLLAPDAELVVNDTGVLPGAPVPLAIGSTEKVNGKNVVVLNRKLVTSATPIHELQHLAFPNLKQSNPDLFRQGEELLRGSDLMKAVQRRYASSGQTAKEEDLMEEAMVTALANNGEALFRAYAGNSRMTQVIKEWLAKFRVWADEFFNSKGIDPNMTIEQFTKKVNDRVLAGKLKPGQEMQVPAQGLESVRASLPEGRVGGYTNPVDNLSVVGSYALGKNGEIYRAKDGHAAWAAENGFTTDKKGEMGEADPDELDAWFKDKGIVRAVSMGQRIYIDPPYSRTQLASLKDVAIEEGKAVTDGVTNRTLFEPQGVSDTRFSLPAEERGSPVVRDLLRRREAGEAISKEELDRAIRDTFPSRKVKVPKSPKDFPSQKQVLDAIHSNKKSAHVETMKKGLPKQGDTITVRQDVPAMTDKGVGVVTTVTPNGTLYRPATRFSDPVFKTNEKASLKIGLGGRKGPHIAIIGKWMEDQSIPADLENWTQVGFNPDRHSVYYERGTERTVVGGSEAFQIGNTVFVKDAVFDDVGTSPIRYSLPAESPLNNASSGGMAQDEEITGTSPQRDAERKTRSALALLGGGKNAVRQIAILKNTYPTEIPPLRDQVGLGMEVRVYLKGDRVWKVTNQANNKFGIGLSDAKEYLERTLRANAEFGDTIAFEGVTRDGRIVTSQNYIRGTTPTEEEVEDALTSLGFLDISGGGDWVTPNGSYVWDTHTGNAIKDSQGRVVIIDAGLDDALRSPDAMSAAREVLKSAPEEVRARFEWVYDTAPQDRDTRYSLPPSVVEASRQFNVEDPTMGARYRGMEGYGVWMLPNGNVIPVDNHAAIAKQLFNTKTSDEGLEKAFGSGMVLVRAIKAGDFRWDENVVMLEGSKSTPTQQRNIRDWAIFNGYTVKSEIGRDGVRYSLTALDQEYFDAINSGNTERQQEIVDEVLDAADFTYEASHGTTHQFNEFDITKGNIDNDMGRGIYLTTSEDDVQQNYEGEGPDLTSRIENLADEIYEAGEDENMGMAEARKLARERLVGPGPRVISARVKMTNPVILDARGFNKGTIIQLSKEPSEYYEKAKGQILSENPGETEEDLEDAINDRQYELASWDMSGGTLDKIREVVNDYEGTDWDELSSALQDKYEIPAFELEKILRNNSGSAYAEDPRTGDMAVGQLISDVFFAIGYDGIIDRNVYNKFGAGRRGTGMGGVYPDTEHYIVRESSQVKSREPITYDNNGEVIPPSQRASSSRDIRFSLPPSTPEDAEYVEAVRAGDMVKSQEIVDAAAKQAGYTVGPVSHATDNDFSVFKPTVRGRFGRGMYFSDKFYASRGKKDVRVYLKNPQVTEIKSPWKRESPKWTPEVYNEYFVTDPADIKSADPVTRDDDGNTLLPSQRFNPASNDIRFSLPPRQTEVVEDGDTVGGLEVQNSDDTPNRSSISASLDAYEVLPGVRKIPMSEFYATGKAYSVSGTNRIKQLAGQIKESGKITPLIAVHDKEGYYILEGATRLEALYLLGVDALPALLVLDETSDAYPSEGRFSLPADTDRFAALLAREDAKRAAATGGSPWTIDGVQKGFNDQDEYVPMWQNVTINDTTHPFAGSTIMVPLEGRSAPLPADVIQAAVDAKRGQKFSLPAPDPDGFYSQMERVIDAKLPSRTTVAQLRGIVENPANVKPEELKWSGLIPWMAGKDTVTKEEVLQFLRNEGGVKFTERIGADNETEEYRTLGRRKRELAEQDFMSPADDAEWEQIKKRQREIAVMPAKYTEYRLPGGENYREVVLAMPENKSLSSEAEAEMAFLQKGSDSGALTPAQTSRLEALKATKIATSRTNYTSSHFAGVPNYVAHMRTNERLDPDGEPGLFIEEIQSDRHQDGRKKGYVEDHDSEGLAAAEAEVSRLAGEIQLRRQEIRSENGLPERLSDLLALGPEVKKKYDDLLNNDEKHRLLRIQKGKAENEANALSGSFSVPDAPFRTAWPLQMFKRALRDAVKTKQEWVGWTPGQVHTDRWGTERIEWKEADNSTAGAYLKIKDGVPPVKWQGTSIRDLGKFDDAEHAQEMLTTVAARWKVDPASIEVDTPERRFFVTAKAQHGGQAGGIDLEAGAVRQGMNKGNSTEVRSVEELERAIAPSLTEGQNPKELAAKLWKRMLTERSGVSMPRKEGFEGFYDTILPKEVGKYVKQWGGVVEKAELPGASAMSGDDILKSIGVSREQWNAMSTDARKAARDTFAATKPIWRVNITPQMAESVRSVGQPRYSLPTQKQSGLSENQPGTAVRAMAAAMTYGTESMLPAYDQALSLYNRKQKAGATFDDHFAELNRLIAESGQTVFNMTPGAYWGIMVKDLRQIIENPASDATEIDTAHNNLRSLIKTMVAVGAQKGQFIKGFDGGLKIANYAAIQVETAEKLVPFDGSLQRRNDFDREVAAANAVLDDLTTEALDKMDETSLTKTIEQRLADVAKAEDSADAAEVAMEDAMLDDIIGTEREASEASKGKLRKGIEALAAKAKNLSDKLLYKMRFLNILSNLDGKFSLPEGQEDVEAAAANIKTKAERDAAAAKTKAEIEALRKQLAAIKDVAVPDGADSDSAEAMAVERLTKALNRLLNPPAKKKLKVTERKIAAAISQALLSKAGLGGRQPSGADSMPFAMGLLLANQETAASVLQQVHDLIQADPETYDAISLDKLRSFMQLAIGKTFDTVEGASPEAAPYGEKQVASLLRSEMKKLGVTMTKVIKDAALSRTTPEALEKQLRDPKRQFVKLLDPETLDKVVSATLAEYRKTAKQRVEANQAKTAKLAAEKAQRKALRDAARADSKEQRAAIREAEKDARSKRAMLYRMQRRDLRRARANAVKAARRSGAPMPVPGRMNPNEAESMLNRSPKRVIEYLARDFGFDIGELVNIARGDQRDAALRDRVLGLANALGLSPSQAERFVQPVIQEAMKKVSETRLKRATKQIENAIRSASGRKPDAKKALTEAQKLIKLAELGGLTLDNVEKVMLGDMNAKKFSPEFREQLERVIEQSNDPNLPQAARDERTATYLGMIKSARGVYAAGLLGEYTMSNIFLNLLSTMKVNAVWGAVKSFADSGIYMARFDPFNLSPSTKIPKGARAALVQAMRRGFTRDLQYQAAYIWNTGRSKLESDYTTQFSNSDLETLAHFPDTEIMLWMNGKPLSPFWASKVKLLAKFSKYTRRAMVGTDLVNRSPAYEMLKANAVVKLIHERADNPPTTAEGWKKAVDDAMYGGNFEEAKKEAFAWVDKEIAEGRLAKTERGVAFGERMESKLGQSLGLTEAERSELLGTAVEYAKRWTVANATEGALGGLSNSLLSMVQNIPGLKFLLPAIRMPIGAFSQGLDWSPYGFIRAQAIGWNKGRSSSVTNYLFNRDGARKTWNMPAGGVPDEMAVELRTKAMIGSTMGIAIAALAAASMDDDEDKAGLFITGRGPENPAANKIWREKGNQPMTIRINGGASIRFQESPAFPILAAIGAWSDSQRYSKPGTMESDKIMYALMRGMGSFADAAVLKNLQDVIEIATGGRSTSGGAEKAGQVTGRLLGVALFPRIGQEVNQILYGPQDTKAGGWAGRLFANIPFTPSLFGKPALNFFGEEIHALRGGPFGEILPMLNHRITAPLTDDPQMLFVARMGGNPLTTTRRFKDGTSVADDYDFVREWQTESGKRLRTYLTPERMARLEALRGRDREEAEKQFDDAMRDIRLSALQSISKGRVLF